MARVCSAIFICWFTSHKWMTPKGFNQPARRFCKRWGEKQIFMMIDNDILWGHRWIDE